MPLTDPLDFALDGDEEQTHLVLKCMNRGIQRPCKLTYGGVALGSPIRAVTYPCTLRTKGRRASVAMVSFLYASSVVLNLYICFQLHVCI